MMLFCSLVLLQIGATCVWCFDLRRDTEYGPVVGRLETSTDGVEYAAFRGIPYARPPLGDLRFKEPQPPVEWQKTRDAIEEAPICIQRNYLFGAEPLIEGQEDCLYLNVFVPKVETVMAVMVFMHWGGFVGGQSTSKFLGPDYFMNEMVVLVTFNYRLGPFGFLSTGDDEAPGNYALKDQLAVLKWVRNNIHNFNGSPDKVTIFGQSAGAGSVHHHMLSPASRGLFHRAITQSGSALALWAFPFTDLQKQVTTWQANWVGCGNHTANTSDTVQCLRSVSAADILKTQDKFHKFHGNPLAVYGPVTETASERNPNPFITKTPLEIMLAGEFANVPWMTGVVRDEGCVRAPSLLRPRKIREELNKNFEKLTTNALLNLMLSTKDPPALYRNLSNFYINGKDCVDLDDPTTIQGFMELYSDRAFVYPLYQSVHIHSLTGHSPIYLYSFEYKGQYTYADRFAGTNETVDYQWGVCHCDDLLYLFRSPEIAPNLHLENDKALSNTLVKIWTYFAYNGNPDYGHSWWKPVNITTKDKHEAHKELNFLRVTGNSSDCARFRMEKGFYSSRMNFWTDSDLFENQWSL